MAQPLVADATLPPRMGGGRATPGERMHPPSRLHVAAGPNPNAEGATVLTDEGLRSEPADGGRVLVVSVPARDVPPGDYQLRLSGVYGDGNSVDHETSDRC